MDTFLNDRHVIVTGASGGIGQSIARAFANESARVTIHYRNNLDAAEALQTSLGDQTHCVAADLTNEQEVEQLFEQAEQAFGPVDLFVANAGQWPSPDEPVAEMTLDRWRQTVDANLTTSFLCMKHFLRHARERNIENPAAIMIGSTAGVFGEAGHSDYAAAKAAIIYGLLPSLKNEFCRVVPNGRINVVNPGWTMTPMTKKIQREPSRTNSGKTDDCSQKICNP